MLNYVQDGLGRLAALQFLSERFACKTIPGLCFVLAQGGIKDHFALNSGSASCDWEDKDMRWFVRAGENSKYELVGVEGGEAR